MHKCSDHCLANMNRRSAYNKNVNRSQALAEGDYSGRLRVTFIQCWKDFANEPIRQQAL